MFENILENYSYIYMLALIFILISTILNILTSSHKIKECILGFLMSIGVLDISILYVISRFSSHPWIVRWQFFVMIGIFVYAAFSDNEMFTMLKNKHLRVICLDIMIYALFEQFLNIGFLNFIFVMFYIIAEGYIFGFVQKIVKWVKDSIYEFKFENGFLKNKDDRNEKKKYNGNDKSNTSSEDEKSENDIEKKDEDEGLDKNENISKVDDDDIEFLD